MPQPGIIRVYNRLPYAVNAQFDSISFTVEPHSEDYLTLPYARCAIKASVWKRNPADYRDVEHGIVPDNHPKFGAPLFQEDIDAANPVLPTQEHGLSWKDALAQTPTGVTPRGRVQKDVFTYGGRTE